MRINSLSLLVTLILCVVLTATAQTASTPTAAIVVPEEKSKPITIPKFDTPPTIDGKLDEEVWQKAAVHPKFSTSPSKRQTNPTKFARRSKPMRTSVGFEGGVLSPG
ncbi:MAG TPA: hypothetical protein VGP83_08080 [Pyrinomonadaceae bacterium]|nr:hypothetical protein [Pyrinomonadaceae bacterium]